MNKLLKYFSTLHSVSQIVICLLLCSLIGILDYFTGDYSVSIFYFIPISFAAWFVGQKTGFIISVVCSIELFINALMIRDNFNMLNVKTWNTFIEICFINFAGYLISIISIEVEKVNKKSKELEEANKELEAFDYTVAHDLRQPLTLLNSYCQVIDKLFGDQLPEECKIYIQDAYKVTLRMNSLIDALINFSRIGQVEPHREIVNLSTMAHELAMLWRLNEPEREVDFRITDGITANCEMSLLRIVLDNLLGNAWKYTSMREKAVIEFGVRDIGGVSTYFVRDNGTGFDIKNAGKLFAPFQRLPGAEKRTGFGIGLATVERIIQRHGGKVWAEGELNSGATFYFTLPNG